MLSSGVFLGSAADLLNRAVIQVSFSMSVLREISKICSYVYCELQYINTIHFNFSFLLMREQRLFLRHSCQALLFPHLAPTA